MIQLLLAAAVAAPLSTKDVPLAEGAFPDHPLTDATVALGAATCTAKVEAAADGAIGSVAVGGCDEAFAAAVRDSLASARIAPGFAKKNPSFEVAVVFDAPTLARKRDAETTLDEALRLEAAPEKYYDKRPFVPRGVKGGLCTVEVWVDAKGEPYAVDLRPCRADLHLAVEMAVMEWRYTPHQVDGQAVPVRFDTLVNVH